MARPLRINIEHGVYHITSRGNDRKDIFLSRDDRAIFLGILSLVVYRYGWLCHAYCLMGNHYHLVVETPRGNLSQGMRQLNGVFTQRSNKKYGRAGHLFQGRFKAILIQKDTHLLAVSRYVVLNPVKAKLCSAAHEYEWSSYNATIGAVKKPSFLCVDWIVSQFGDRRAAAQRRYAEFVNSGRKENIWDKLTGQIYLGNKDFVKKISESAPALEEVPRIQKQPFRPRLSEILKRENGIAVAYREHGYLLKDIARHLNVHYATISRKLKRIEAPENV